MEMHDLPKNSWNITTAIGFLLKHFKKQTVEDDARMSSTHRKQIHLWRAVCVLKQRKHI